MERDFLINPFQVSVYAAVGLHSSLPQLECVRVLQVCVYPDLSADVSLVSRTVSPESVYLTAGSVKEELT